MTGRIRTSTAGKANNRGFTLIELCVVVVLIGTVMFIAAPRIHDAVFKDSLRQAVKQIVAKSRESAQRRRPGQHDYVLHFDRITAASGMRHPI